MSHNSDAYFSAKCNLNVLKIAKVAEEISDISMEVAIFNHNPNEWGAREFLSGLSTKYILVEAIDEDRGYFIYKIRGEIKPLGNLTIINLI